MPIKTDWNISMDFDELSNVPSMKRILANANASEEYAESLSAAQRMMKPAAIWDGFAVREFRHKQIILENGVKIAGGPVADVMGGSTILYVGFCTVGAEVCQAASDARQSDHKLRAMYLDFFSSAAVGMIRQQWTDLMQAEAKAAGLHHSAMLSPGESTWPLSQQEVLFSLVDASQIGVHLTDGMMMSPVKSLSMILGTSPNAIGSEGGVNCDYCTMRDTCEHSQAGSRKPLGE